MRTKFVGLLLASLFVFGVCSTAFAADTPNLGVTAPFVATAPVIDGDLSDAAWLTASQMGAKVVIDQQYLGEFIALYPRVGYLAYDATNLYIAFVIMTPDVTKLVTTLGISSNDEIELFILPTGATAYTKITLDAGGASKIKNITGQPTFASTKDGIRWVLEVAVPFVNLGVTPKAGDVWGIGLCGHQATPTDVFLTWNPTYGLFANTARFGVLTFGQ